MIQLGSSLRAAARDLGLSDAEVARRAGLTERRYGHYVTGAREPDLGTLLRICQVLGVAPNDLLRPSTSKPSPGDKLRARLLSAAQSLSKSDLELLVVQAEAVARFKSR